ncbi:MAG: biotin/lipoate A/B protein ligase family protein [Halodesulfurarchaeum sp.]
MTLSERDWRLVPEESRSGPMNMALDEVAADTVAAGGPPTLRIYRWQPGTFSLGYNQDSATVDWEYCESAGLSVTRRPTGGGGILHDRWGDISYSIIAPAGELPGTLLDSYHQLLEPIFDAFDRLGLDASFVDEERPGIYEPACYLRPLDPAHDIVLDGRKVSGNAQYRQREAIIQHGSITYEAVPESHLAVFNDVEATHSDFRHRVTGIREHVEIPRGEAVATVEEALREWAGAEVGGWKLSELVAARTQAERKYRSPQWNRDGEDLTE